MPTEFYNFIYIIRIKNITFVEDNVLCKYAKFQLFLGKIMNIFFENFPPMLPRQIKLFFNFHFSHFKSMVTLGCHSNQRFYPTRIRNTTNIEANVISMYDKFQLHTPFGL